MRDKAQPGFLDGGEGQFAAHARILLKVLIQRVSAFPSGK